MWKTIALLVLILHIGKSAAFCTITNKNVTEDLKNCEQPITNLKLLNSSVIEILSQIPEKNNEITFIDISGVGLKSIESASFCVFKKLTAIDFSKNNLTILPKQMLSNCETHMNDLDFSFNQITELTDNIFVKLSSLTKIDLSSNRIERLVDDVFKPLVNLLTLRLNNNRISVIDDDLFIHNSNLITLTLHNNMLVAIGNGSFNGLKELRALEIGNNPNLKDIDFSGMRKLQRVQIENCSLSVLHIPTYGKVIIATNNNISHIKAGQNELEFLDLSMNRIQNLIDLSPLTHLKELDLSNNELIEMNFSQLATLSNLTRLNIIGNPIKKLDTKSLKKFLPSVRNIGISAESSECANMEGCREWMETSKMRLSPIENESASNITNSTKLKTTTIRSLPRPPIFSNDKEISTLERVQRLEEKDDQQDSNIRLNHTLAVVSYFAAIFFDILFILGFIAYRRCKKAPREVFRTRPNLNEFHRDSNSDASQVLVEAEDTV